MQTSPGDEILALRTLLLACIERRPLSFYRQMEHVREVCNLAIQTHRDLLLDHLDASIFDSLSEVKFLIRMRFLQY